MNTHTTFSFSRMTAVLRHDFFSDWKTHLNEFLAVTGGFLIFFLSTMRTDLPSNVLDTAGELSAYGITYKVFCRNTASFISLFACLFILLYASQIMRTMSTKEKCIAYLMLPATQLEKFVARALTVTLGMAVTFIAALASAEILRLAAVNIFGYPELYNQWCLGDAWNVLWGSQRPNIIITGGIPEVQQTQFILGIANSALAFVWFHSLLVLGGSYFYKRPLIKTMCILFASLFGLGLIIFNLPGGIVRWMADFFAETAQHIDKTDIMIVTSIFLVLFIVLNWVVSYKLFTRSQIIKRKLFKL